GRARVLDQALAVTRLGTGLRPGGRLDADALAQTRDAVVAFAARARARGAPRVWAFATAALREAADGSAAADAIAAAAGVPVEVLSGEREAALAYAAVAAGETPLLAADVGGRTTELTLGVGERVLGVASLPLGALALTEAHGADLDGAHAAVGAVLAASELPSRARADPARGRARAGAVGRRTRRRRDRRERSRRAPCLPARGPRARRPAGRLRGALAMTADELARAIAASGVRDTARVAEAARAVA